MLLHLDSHVGVDGADVVGHVSRAILQILSLTVLTLGDFLAVLGLDLVEVQPQRRPLAQALPLRHHGFRVAKHDHRGSVHFPTNFAITAMRLWREFDAFSFYPQLRRRLIIQSLTPTSFFVCLKAIQPQER